MTETVTETGQTFRYLSPPEYIKAANARDEKVKHSIDLHHFMAFYRDRQGHQGTTAATVDEIIADYLDSLEEGK